MGERIPNGWYVKDGAYYVTWTSAAFDANHGSKKIL